MIKAQVRINAGKTCTLYYTLNGPNMPINKTKLVSFPSYISYDPGADYNGYTTAVAYLFFVPERTNPSQNKLIESYTNGSSMDTMVSMKGTTLTVGGYTVSAPESYIMVPMESAVGNGSGGRTCAGVDFGSSNRGGTCFLSSTATLSVGGIDVDSALALLLVTPKVIIAGNAYAGNQSNASNIIMPGSHVSSDTILGSTAAEIINFGSSGSGMWDPVMVYNNVKLTSNINRIKNLADMEMRGGGSTDNLNAFPGTTYNSVTNEIVMDFSIARGNHNLDLSTPAIRTGNATSTSSRRDGYVLHVKNNLVIKGDGKSSTEAIKNLTTGTIIVDGYIRIEDVSVDASDHPLGLMALDSLVTGDNNSKSIQWNVSSAADSSFKSSLEHLAFFSKHKLVATEDKSTQAMYLNGLMTAETIDLSGVKTSTTDADLLNLAVVYDADMASNPPPGFSIFSSTPLLKEKN